MKVQHHHIAQQTNRKSHIDTITSIITTSSIFLQTRCFDYHYVLCITRYQFEYLLCFLRLRNILILCSKVQPFTTISKMRKIHKNDSTMLLQSIERQTTATDFIKKQPHLLNETQINLDVYWLRYESPNSWCWSSIFRIRYINDCIYGSII
jgi:hypothetical protein